MAPELNAAPQSRFETIASAVVSAEADLDPQRRYRSASVQAPRKLRPCARLACQNRRAIVCLHSSTMSRYQSVGTSACASSSIVHISPRAHPLTIRITRAHSIFLLGIKVPKPAHTESTPSRLHSILPKRSTPYAGTARRSIIRFLVQLMPVGFEVLPWTKDVLPSAPLKSRSCHRSFWTPALPAWRLPLIISEFTFGPHVIP